MHSIRLITFDVTNTLMKVKNSIGYYYYKIADLYGLESNTEETIDLINKNFKPSLKEMKKLSPLFGAVEGIPCNQWWYRVMHKTFSSSGIDLSSSDAEKKFKLTSAHLYKLFSTSEPYQLADGAYDTLTALRNKNQVKSGEIKIGVLSNSDERLPLILGQFGIAHFFDFINQPQICKVEKPDPRAFQLALEKSEAKGPEQAIHIGDDLVKDYRAAKHCGWNAIFFDIKNNQSDSVDHKDKIISLEQLLNHEVIKQIV